MFRNNVFTITLFGSLCVSVTAANAEVAYKEDFTGFYSNGASAQITDPDNKALNTGDVNWWGSGEDGTKIVDVSTISTYDTTGGLTSVPIPTNPAINTSDIPAGRGGDITTKGAIYFPYPPGTKKTKEQRFEVMPFALDGRPGLEEVWIQYDQFIPSNFYDRAVSGEWGSKVLVVYAEAYGAGNPLFVWGRGNKPAGNSSIAGEFQHEEVAGEGRIYTRFNGGSPTIDLSIDRGKWQRRTVHIKLPTTQSSNDGVMEVWIRHGDNVVRKHVEIFNGDFRDIDEPWMRRGYLLGWSNNGFDEATSFLITNFILAESAQHIDKEAIVYVAPPRPPIIVAVP